jgi:hypothetical protein
MERLKAQAAISELLSQHDLLAGYASRLNGHGLQPWKAHDQAQAEAAAAAYHEAAHVVARHFAIRLTVQTER